MNEVQVSVIVPAYNVQEYIKECLESLIKQSFRFFEVIIINDGSTDETGNIINSYARKYKFIKIINQKNKGLSAARNIGLKEAKGEFIYFLDSDDIVSENLLEECFQRCKNNKLDLIMFDGKAFFDRNFSENKENFKMNYSRYGILTEKVQNGIEFLVSNLNNSGYRSSVCLLFFKKSIVEENNLFFLEGIVHEDELFTPVLISKCKKLMWINKILFFRRVRNESIMTTPKNYKNIQGYLAVARELLKSVNEKKLKYTIEKKVNNLSDLILLLTSNIGKKEKKSVEKDIKIILRQIDYKSNKLLIKLYFPCLLKLISLIKKMKSN